MILPLEKQVCSLDLAIRLKELNVRQDSLYHWKKWYQNGLEIIQPKMNVEENYPFRFSAFTSSELGELLPEYIYKNEICYFLEMYKHSDEGFQIRYKDGAYSIFENKECVLKCLACKNEADARAKMLIYLLENNLIKLEDINKGE